MIKIGSEKFGLIQLSLLIALKDKPKNTSELLRIFKNLGLKTRSSFYAALNELVKTGYIERINEDGYKLTEKGMEIVNKIPNYAFNFLPFLFLYSFILSKAGIEIVSESDEIEDIDELLAYKEYLLKELEVVNEKLKKWKKIKVE